MWLPRLRAGLSSRSQSVATFPYEICRSERNIRQICAFRLLPGTTRHSSGFEQFQALLQGSETSSILDLSSANQANIMFLAGAGHRISSDDIIGAMIDAFGTSFNETQQTEAKAATRFLEQTLSFPPQSFDGALVWDAFQFLPPPLINQTVDKLLRGMRPGGIILAFFNANERIKEIPLYHYRIQGR